MQQNQLNKFRTWFRVYVSDFYGDDEYVNANLKLKEEHTCRTCEEMLYLTKELDLSDERIRLAQVIALFHDIGRFEQFVRHRTYVDGRSVNHCLMGLEVLRQAKVLDDVDQKERLWIEKAIEYHGLKELPPGLNSDCLLFSKLIRDADKIDSLYVMTECLRQYADNPRQYKLEIEVPDKPGYSDEVVQALLRGRPIDYGWMKTLNDMKLCLLGWIFDVNFVPTLKRIRQRRLIQILIDFLPKTRDIKKVEEKMFDYVDLRINQERTGKGQVG